MRECFRQGQAEVVSSSRNKIHQTWGPPFGRALYFIGGFAKVLGPELIFPTGLVKFVTAVARLVCPDLLG